MSAPEDAAKATAGDGLAVLGWDRDERGMVTMRLMRQAPMNDFLRQRYGTPSFLERVMATGEWITRGDTMTDESTVAKAYRLLLAKTRTELAEGLVEGRYSVPDESILPFIATKVLVIQECLDGIAAGQPPAPPSLKHKLNIYGACDWIKEGEVVKIDPDGKMVPADDTDGGTRYRQDDTTMVRDMRAPLADIAAPKGYHNAMWFRTGEGPKTGCGVTIGEPIGVVERERLSTVGHQLPIMSRCEGALGKCPYGVVAGYGLDVANAGKRPPGAPDFATSVLHRDWRDVPRDEGGKALELGAFRVVDPEDIKRIKRGSDGPGATFIDRRDDT